MKSLPRIPVVALTVLPRLLLGAGGPPGQDVLQWLGQCQPPTLGLPDTSPDYYVVHFSKQK